MAKNTIMRIKMPVKHNKHVNSPGGRGCHHYSRTKIARRLTHYDTLKHDNRENRTRSDTIKHEKTHYTRRRGRLLPLSESPEVTFRLQPLVLGKHLASPRVTSARVTSASPLPHLRISVTSFSSRIAYKWFCCVSAVLPGLSFFSDPNGTPIHNSDVAVR